MNVSSGSGPNGAPCDLAAEWAAPATGDADVDPSRGEDEAGSPSFGQLLGGALVAAGMAPGAPANADANASRGASEVPTAPGSASRQSPQAVQLAQAGQLPDAIAKLMQSAATIEVHGGPPSANPTLPTTSIASPTSAATTALILDGKPSATATLSLNRTPAATAAPTPTWIPDATPSPNPNSIALPNLGLLQVQNPPGAGASGLLSAPGSLHRAVQGLGEEGLVRTQSGDSGPIDLRSDTGELGAPAAPAPAQFDGGSGEHGADEHGERPLPHSTLLHHTPATATERGSATMNADPTSLVDSLAEEAARTRAEDPGQPSPARELGHSSARITLGEGDTRVALWVAVRGDSVRVEARAHSAAYADALNQRSDELASGLAERGLVLGSMSADVAGERSTHQQMSEPDGRADRRGQQDDPDRPEEPDPIRPRGVRAIA